MLSHMPAAQRVLLFAIAALMGVFITSLVLLAARGNADEEPGLLSGLTPVPTRQATAGAASTSVAPTQTPAPVATATQPQLSEGPVRASVETEPVPRDGDAADDPAIFVHPDDPSLSVVIGTDKDGGGLAVYGLDGRQLQYLDTGEVNNVDLRQDFALGGRNVVLLAASNRSDNSIAVYQLDTGTRSLSTVTARNNRSSIDVYGLCMYRSPRTGSFYAFVTEDGGGNVEQWEIRPDGDGVTLNRVRTLRLGGQGEGCAADDVTGALYLGEEDQGLWRYGAEPDAGSDRRQVDSTRGGGRLEADVEGVAIYYGEGESGYVVVSSQGDDSYVLYDRSSNAYAGTFSIVDGAVDGTQETDGLDVTSRGLGPSFPYGLLVVQDGENRDGNRGARQNFKLVPWEIIAGHFQPPLQVYTR